MGNSNSGPPCRRCGRSMDKEDFTDSTCKSSACDTCQLLVAGTVGYSCSSCRYKVHRVCPVPPATANVQQQAPGVGTQLGIAAANGAVSGVVREVIHGAAGSISSSHPRQDLATMAKDNMPSDISDNGQGGAFDFIMDF